MVDTFLIDRETRDRGRTTKYPYFSPLFGHIIFCIFLVNQYIKFYLSSWRTCTSHTFVFLSRTCHVGFVRYMWGFIYQYGLLWNLYWLFQKSPKRISFHSRPYGVFQKSPKRIRFYCRPYGVFQKSPKRIRFHSRPYWLFQKSPKRIRFHSRPYGVFQKSPKRIRFHSRPYWLFQKSPKRIRFHSRPYWLFQKSPKRIRFHSRPYWYMNPHIYLTKPTWQVLDRKTKVCDVQVLQLDK
jgi:hypothetical protein